MSSADSAVLASTAMAGNPYITLGAEALKNAAGGAAAPSAANQSTQAAFDSSGWNVSFGSGDIAATTDKASSLGGGSMGNYAPYVMFLVGAVVLWKMTKKS